MRRICTRATRIRLTALLYGIAIVSVAQAEVPIAGDWFTGLRASAGPADYLEAIVHISPRGDLWASAGCNRFRARVTLDQSGRIFLSNPIVSTIRVCLPEIEKAEMRFIESLRASRFVRLASQTLHLEDEHRVTVLELARKG